MARFRTKSRPEASRFVRSLLERGLRRTPPVHRLEPIRPGTFRVYPETSRGKATGWIRVSFYEARTGPMKRIPKPLPRRAKPELPHCRTYGHHARPIYYRGLCIACYLRFRYWTALDEDRLELARRRNRERTAKRKAAGREAA